MIVVEITMLLCLLFFGGYCAYTDIKTGIVPNKMIIMGFLIGVALHAALLIIGAGNYYLYWIINMLIGDVIAFAMFMGKMWAAGDAKLFMLLFFFIPPRLIDAELLSHAILPYVCIFVPALLWMIVDSTVRIARNEKRKHQQFSIKRFLIGIFVIVVETTAFNSLCLVLFPAFIVKQAFFYSALLLAYAYVCGTVQFMKKWYIVTIHGIVILVLTIMGKLQLELPYWKNYLVMAFAIIMQKYCSLYNYQYIATSKVKKGMIPAAETIILFQKSKVHSLPTDFSEELTAKITEDEADAIKRWEKSANGEPNIWIVRKVPFAIMIYIGFICWTCIRIWGR